MQLGNDVSSRLVVKLQSLVAAVKRGLDDVSRQAAFTRQVRRFLAADGRGRVQVTSRPRHTACKHYRADDIAPPAWGHQRKQPAPTAEPVPTGRLRL